MSGVISIAVIDDHPMFRQGLIWSLKQVKGFEVVGEGSTAGEAIAIAATHKPDLMIVDLHLRAASDEGIAIAQLIRNSYPEIKIIFLTVSEDPRHVAAALKVGASGYVLKGVGANDIVQIVRDVHAGKQHVSPDLAARLLTRADANAAKAQPVGETQHLTSREDQILTLVCRGLTNKEVARELSISDKTVKHYMTAIMQKLGVRNRTEAVLYRERNSSA